MKKTLESAFGIAPISTGVFAGELRICRALKIDVGADWEKACRNMLEKDHKEGGFLLSQGALIGQEQTISNKLAAEQTEFAVGQDNRNLYLAIECSDPRGTNLAANCREADGGVWGGDFVEIFISPRHGVGNYYRFIVNPLGAKYEACGVDTGWPCGWEAKAVSGEKSWIALVSIPFAGLKIQPDDKTIMELNICRGRCAESVWEFSSWSYSAGSFHNPENFGVMLLGDPMQCLQKSFLKSYREKYAQALDNFLKIQGGQIDDSGKESLDRMKNILDKIGAELARADRTGAGFKELANIWIKTDKLMNKCDEVRDVYQNQAEKISATMWV
ncbi:MAG: hypothetical protein NT011_03220 [Kiritimatiellaeota bacterium]|nr:hypothetical protein [Kiritimatiellota bacterium]